jgi:hypothetical protein
VRFCIGGAVLILLLVTVRALLPGAVERAAAYGSRHFFGLPARIGNVDLALFAGGVTLEDVSVGAMPDGVVATDAAFRVPEIDRSSALLHFDRISVKWSWGALFARKIQIAELSMDSPSARILQEADGTIDPLRHAHHGAPQTTAEPAKSEPWALEVRQLMLRSPAVVLVDAESGQNLFEFGLEIFKLDRVEVAGNEVGLGALAIRGPEFSVQREWVLAERRLGAGPAAKNVAAPDPPSALPALRMDSINVERAKFKWITKDGPLDVQWTFHSTGLTAATGKTFPIEAALQIGTGKIALKGTTGILPPYFDGRVEWKNLLLPPLLQASGHGAAVWLQGAETRGDLHLKAALAGEAGAPFLRLSGRASVDDFEIVEPGNRFVSVGWKNLDVVMSEVFVPIPEEGKSTRPMRADLESIRLVDPKVFYLRPWPPLEEWVLAALAGPPGAAGPAPETDWLKLSLAALDVTGGEIAWKDTTVAAEASVHDVAASMRDFRFPESIFSALSLSATVPTDSKLTVTGDLAAGNSGNFLIGLQDLELSPWSPYAAASGVALKAGRASLQTKLETRGAVIKADNQIILNQLEMAMLGSDFFAREFGMPINLALVLLRDASGNIELKVPVQMDETGAAISFGSVMGSAMRAAVLAALSSPLKVVNTGLGIGQPQRGRADAKAGTSPLALGSIAFEPGRAEPAPGADARAAKFVKLLRERPAIGLVLRGRTGDADRPALAEQFLLEQVRERKGLPEVAGAGFPTRRWIAGYLLRRAKGEAAELSEKDREVFQRFLAAADVSPERFAELANTRSQKVRQLLIEKGANPKNVSIGEPQAPGEPGVDISLGEKTPSPEVPAKPKAKRR